MIARIIIRNLIVQGRYGVTDKERSLPQTIRIDVWATVSIDEAALSDDIDYALNWSTFRQIIISTVESNSYQLIERLAMTLSNTILEDKKITNLKLRISKMQAFKNGIPSLEIERSNQ
jgi:dihydroneopterin aldolase